MAPLMEAWVSLTALLSFLWAFWDPTWLQARNERSLGRPSEVVGRSTFIVRLTSAIASSRMKLTLLSEQAIQITLYFLRLLLSITHYFQLVRDPQLVRQAAAVSLLLFASVSAISGFFHSITTNKALL